MKSRALTRHHDKRIKKKRIKSIRFLDKSDQRLVGVHATTACRCSCWMCGNQRKHHGVTFQEKKHQQHIDECNAIYP